MVVVITPESSNFLISENLGLGAVCLLTHTHTHSCSTLLENVYQIQTSVYKNLEAGVVTQTCNKALGEPRQEGH